MEEGISEKRKVQLDLRTTLNEASLHLINGLAAFSRTLGVCRKPETAFARLDFHQTYKSDCCSSGS